MNPTQNALLNSPAGRQWQKIRIGDHHGIVLPIFSLHSQSSCGVGEYTDLIPMIDWCQKVGFEVIQLLPINDTGLETSPYSALSAFALNPIHLGLSQLSYAEKDTGLLQMIKELQSLTLSSQRVDYKKIQPLREKFLREYFRLFGPLIRNLPAYQTFQDTHKYWLHDYAVFKALKITQNWKPWEEWAFEFRHPSPSFYQQLPATLKAEADFHEFVQYLCFEQLQRVKQHAEKAHILIKGDIPILINKESADVWCHPELFSLEYAAGAPPDMYAQEGQKWGFPIYRWENAAAEHYRWWIERLNTAAQFYHLYRLDHIVGFFRIWAIPLALPAKMGGFIPQDEKKWIPQGKSIMQIMLENCGMLPIGEDLGTIPDEVRQCMRELGICGTKVMRWERHWHGDKSFIDPKAYAKESMTTVSTHDSETLKLWWKNQPEEAKLYAESRGWEYSPVLTRDQHFAILQASHRSGSLFHINLFQEYLALIQNMTWPNMEEERINIPGTISEDNWSYRFRPSVEEIVNSQELLSTLQELQH